MSEVVEIRLTVPQIFVLRQMLQMEMTSNLRMSRRETALQAFKRLTGVDPGRGAKGRQRALDILAQFDIDEEE